MNNGSRSNPLMRRGAGVILPIFSLPSEYGIGALDKTAHDFVDFLSDAGQRFWQMLPIGPTGYGDSPYASLSVFAGNPVFIDLEPLVTKGLIKEHELAEANFGGDPRFVEYAAVSSAKQALLQRAFERDDRVNGREYAAFYEKNAEWLDDYALFMALKARFDMRAWYSWEDEGARLHKKPALDLWRRKLRRETGFHIYTQFLFYDQWKKLKAHSASRGVKLIGDVPIYCALDSSDVWAAPEQFQLDENNAPRLVAGVPPDAFSEDGQLWGNPLYDWERMKKSGYSWWIRRLKSARSLYDIIRLDHFRGLESYWAVPADEKTAKNGRWLKGPGMDFIGAVKAALPRLALIAEDLGYLTPEVHALRKAARIPGMKVLEFAFDPSGTSTYLPHNCEKNCVLYTGTHDNAPLGQYLNEADAGEIDFIKRYTGVENDNNLHGAILRLGLASSANCFIAQMQDWLGASDDCRINTPGTTEGNWRWRMIKGEPTPELAARMRGLCALYGRL